MTPTQDPNGDASASPPGWGRVEVHAGPGVVDRHGDALLVVPSVGAGQAERTAELLQLHRHTPDPTGRRRLRHAAWVLTEAEPEEVPAFALVVGTGTALRVLVHGGLTVTVHGPAEQSFSAADALTWLERTIDAPYDRVTVVGEPAGAETAPGAVPFDLEAGTVPGSGVTLWAARLPQPPLLARVPGTAREPAPVSPLSTPVPTAEPIPVPAAEPIPVPTQPAAPPPAPAQPARPHPTQPAPAPASAVTQGHTVLRAVAPFRSMRLAGRPGGPAGSGGPSTSRRPPLPVGTATPPGSAAPPRPGEVVMVEGVVCRAGHFGDPEETTCRTCGAPRESGSERVTQPRPPLGVLVTDDGSVFTLTGDYVLGRDPGRAPAVLSGAAAPLVLRDEEHSTSRVHARLTLSGWTVRVSDGGSANGTFVSRSGPAGPWTPVDTGTGTRLYPGDRVRVGHRQLLFDCYHEPLRP